MKLENTHLNIRQALVERRHICHVLIALDDQLKLEPLVELFSIPCMAQQMLDYFQSSGAPVD